MEQCSIIISHLKMNGCYSLSEGTLNPQDLIPKFLDALRDLGQEKYSNFDNTELPFILWDSEKAQELLDDLQDALDEAAPEGFRFGTHEGDGANFGFWPE